MTPIFISYSRTDFTFASQLANQLIAMGLDVFLDVDDIHAGADWSDVIQQGLETSELMLLIVSPASMQSQQVAREWKYFVGRNKPIVPLQWKTAQLHYQIDGLQRINFETQSFEVAFQQLVAQLTRMGAFSQPPTPSAPATPTPTAPRKRFPYGLAVVGLLMILAAIGGVILLSGVLDTDDDQGSNDQSSHLPTATTAPTDADQLTYSVLNIAPEGGIESGWIGAWEVNMASGREFYRAAEGYSIGFSWSPDGQHLIVIEGTADFDTVKLIDKDGGNPRSIISMGDDINEDVETVAWSSDGQYLAYVLRDTQATPTSTAVWVYDVRTESTQQVLLKTALYTMHIAWANHSNVLAVFDIAGAGAGQSPAVLSLWDVSSQTIGLVKQFQHVAYLNSIQWYKDDSGMLIAAEIPDLDSTQSTQLYKVSLEGQVTMLTNTDTNKDEATFSPDGTLLAFTDDYNATCDRIWLMRVSNHEVIGSVGAGGFEVQDFCDRGPLWSPDSRRIAFVRDPYNDDSGMDMLCWVEVGTLVPIKVADILGSFDDSGSYNWSPDNQYFAYVGLVLSPESATIYTAESMKLDIYVVTVAAPDQALAITDLAPSTTVSAGNYPGYLLWRSSQ